MAKAGNTEFCPKPSLLVDPGRFYRSGENIHFFSRAGCPSLHAVSYLPTLSFPYRFQEDFGIYNGFTLTDPLPAGEPPRPLVGALHFPFQVSPLFVDKQE